MAHTAPSAAIGTEAAAGGWIGRALRYFAHNRPALGLAIIMGGQPVAWAVRGAVSEGSSPVFPAVAVLLGLALLMRPEWLITRTVHCPPAAVALPVFGLLSPMVLLALTNPQALLIYGAYAGFLVPVTLAVALTPSTELRHFTIWMLLVGSISVMAPIVQLGIYGPQEGFYRLAVVGNENPLILATIGSITVLASLVLFATSDSRSILLGAGYALLMALAIGVVVMTNTRSAVAGLLFCFLIYPILHWRRARTRAVRSRRRATGFFLTLALLAAGAPVAFTAFIGTEAAGVFAERSWNRVEGTIGTVFGDELDVDESSLGRITIIEETLAGLSPFGKGMMAQELVMGQGYYPHLTYLHAFYDLGILGGILFFLLAFAIPMAILFTRFLIGGLERNDIFIMLLFAYHQTDHLTHGAPYSWTLLVPSLLAYVVIWRFPGFQPQRLMLGLPKAAHTA